MIFLFLVAIFPLPELFAQSLIFPEDEPVVFHQSTNTKYIRQDGTGESSDTAPIFHIPVATPANQMHMTTDNLAASLLTGNEARTLLSIPLKVSISNREDVWDVFIAAQKSNSEQYQIVYNLPNVTDGQTLNLLPDLKDICAADNDLTLDCSRFQSGGDDREEILLFLGIGIQGDVDHTPTADSIDPTNYEEGHYIELKLSSIVTTSAPTLNKLYKGESRLQVDFQGMKIEEGDSLYAYINNFGSIASDENCSNQNRAAATSYSTLPQGGKHQKLGTIATGGKATVKGLNNGDCYSIQIYYRDKYGFASGVSGGFNASPELLEKLLERNSCFLLTAGFGGDHPIIDDFRHFRDHTLQHSPLGRAFVRTYYRYAPTLAPLVSHSPLLSNMIRSAARRVHWLFLRPRKKSP